MIAPSSEAGLIGIVVRIPADNGDAFSGLVLRNDTGQKVFDTYVGGSLSWPWEFVEPALDPRRVIYVDGNSAGVSNV